MSETSWGVSGGYNAANRRAGTLTGFRRQLRVIHALLLRETQTRFGRKRIGLIAMFIEPLLAAGALAALRSWFQFGPQVPGVSMFVFALVSYLPFFTFRSIVARAPGTLRSNIPLLYHSSIKLIDAVLARHALEMVAVIGVMTLIMFGIAFWSGTSPNSVPMLLVGLVLILLLSHGVGLIVAAMAVLWPGVERVIQVVLFISLPLSGAFVAVQMLDPIIQQVLLWNPQVHMHEMVRHGVFGDKLLSHFDIGYAAFCVAVINLLGLASLRAAQPKIRL
jgi:capsular polysaccharide transport system permease protein